MWWELAVPVCLSCYVLRSSEAGTIDCSLVLPISLSQGCGTLVIPSTEWGDVSLPL